MGDGGQRPAPVVDVDVAEVVRVGRPTAEDDGDAASRETAWEGVRAVKGDHEHPLTVSARQVSIEAVGVRSRMRGQQHELALAQG